MRCSYFKVFYGDDANFLNHKITKDYMSNAQTFKAKVAIVQVGPIIDIFFCDPFNMHRSCPLSLTDY